MVLNPENHCIPRRHRSLIGTTEQQLNNFGTQNLENISNFEARGLNLVAYQNIKRSRQGKEKKPFQGR